MLAISNSSTESEAPKKLWYHMLVSWSQEKRQDFWHRSIADRVVIFPTNTNYLTSFKSAGIVNIPGILMSQKNLWHHQSQSLWLNCNFLLISGVNSTENNVICVWYTVFSVNCETAIWYKKSNAFNCYMNLGVSLNTSIWVNLNSLSFSPAWKNP